MERCGAFSRAPLAIAINFWVVGQQLQRSIARCAPSNRLMSGPLYPFATITTICGISISRCAAVCFGCEPYVPATPSVRFSFWDLFFPSSAHFGVRGSYIPLVFAGLYSQRNQQFPHGGGPHGAETRTDRRNVLPSSC